MAYLNRPARSWSEHDRSWPEDDLSYINEDRPRTGRQDERRSLWQLLRRACDWTVTSFLYHEYRKVPAAKSAKSAKSTRFTKSKASEEEKQSFDLKTALYPNSKPVFTYLTPVTPRKMADEELSRLPMIEERNEYIRRVSYCLPSRLNHRTLTMTCSAVAVRQPDASTRSLRGLGTTSPPSTTCVALLLADEARLLGKIGDDLVAQYMCAMMLADVGTVRGRWISIVELGWCCLEAYEGQREWCRCPEKTKG